MTQQEDTSSRDAEQRERLDESLILDLNFVPEWARREPGAVAYAGQGRTPSRGTREHPGGPRGGRGDRTGPPQHKAPRPHPRLASDRPHGAAADRRPRPAPPAPIELPPLRIRFLPEQKTLAAIVRRIRSTRRAYPVDQLAAFILGASDACYAKVEPERGNEPVSIFQCTDCRAIALNREELIDHVSVAHRDAYLTVEEVTIEEPSGTFSSVAICGLSGVLLGPPNHHSYAEKILEMHRSRYSTMPIEAYRDRIRTVRDEETIARWKTEYCTQTRYKPTTAQGASSNPMEAAEAQQYMRETIAPANVVRVKTASLPLDTARAITNPSLQEAFAGAWHRTNRFPRDLILALRAAFKHMHLHLFRVGREHEFVLPVQPSPLDPEHTVDSIRETLLFLQEHPGCRRAALVEGLRPDVAPESPEVVQILTPLTWLIDKGHIIEFFDGSLAVPLGKHRAAKSTAPEPKRRA